MTKSAASAASAASASNRTSPLWMTIIRLLMLNSPVVISADYNRASMSLNLSQQLSGDTMSKGNYNNNNNQYKTASESDFLNGDIVIQFLMRNNENNKRYYNNGFKSTSTTIANNNNNNSGHNFGHDDKGYNYNNGYISKDYNDIQNEEKSRRTNTEDFEPSTSAKFISLCQNFLLSDEIVQDNQITNVEFALFFEYLCTELPKESCIGQEIPFYSLSMEIQLTFIDMICPRDKETNLYIDPACIDSLFNDIQHKNQFGYIIDEHDNLNQDAEQYCTNLYALSAKYHNGTYEPSPSPSSSPSITSKPSLIPTLLPSTVVSNKPSASPSLRPSISPTTPRPSDSPTTPEPSHAPIEFKVAFTYMMGFDDAQVQSNVLDDTQPEIMNSISIAIANILYDKAPEMIGQKNHSERRYIIRSLRDSSPKLSDPSPLSVEKLNIQHHLLEKLILWNDENNNNNGVEHLLYQDQECDESFTKSEKCIIVVSQVTLVSSIQRTKETVHELVSTSIQSSMNDDSFRNKTNVEGINEVKYIGDGYNIPLSSSGIGTTNIDDGTTSSGVGGGYVSGVTIASVLLFVVFAFVIRRRVANPKDGNEIKASDSDLEEASESNIEGISEPDTDDNDSNLAPVELKLNFGMSSHDSDSDSDLSFDWQDIARNPKANRFQNAPYSFENIIPPDGKYIY